MKVKTLRFKDGFKEFAMFDEEGSLYTSETPQLLPTTATMEDLIKYHSEEYSEDDINFDDLEIVEFEMYEADTVGADIRNKLSPSKNLVSLLEEFFTEPFEPRSNLEKMKQNDLIRSIKKEMIETKINIKYIADLL